MNKKVSRIVDVAIVILAFLISIGGFMRIADEYYTKDLVGLMTLFTLPAIIGALLANTTKYKKESKLFLIATLSLFIGLFSMKSEIKGVDSVGSLMVFIGGFIYIYSLLRTILISVTTKN